jgi:putative effector of murein hydrolase
MIDFVDLWVYLAGEPLLWLTVTLVAYVIADWISLYFNRHPAANPVLISVVIVSLMLVATGTAFPTYFAGAQFIHFLLGPAIVALAVPLARHLPDVKRALLPMSVALVAGSTAAIASSVVIAQWLGLDRANVLALAPKSSTAPIAMGIAETIGGDPALTAVLTIATGITGAMIVTPLMNALRLKNYAARGFAAGLAAHGIGTARAFQVNKARLPRGLADRAARAPRSPPRARCWRRSARSTSATASSRWRRRRSNTPTRSASSCPTRTGRTRACSRSRTTTSSGCRCATT